MGQMESTSPSPPPSTGEVSSSYGDGGVMTRCIERHERHWSGALPAMSVFAYARNVTPLPAKTRTPPHLNGEEK